MAWKPRLAHQVLPDQLLAATTTTRVEPGHIDPGCIIRCTAYCFYVLSMTC
nr:hypothetical protein HmN_000566800 [Hymenolepis microstoma]